MNKVDRVFDEDTENFEAFNKFVLDIFWLDGFFLHAADRITAGSVLTTARWQVLGAVLHQPLTVPTIARNMGLARQSVQRIADILVEEGLCEYKSNPAHRRSKLLISTEQGLESILKIRPKVLAWAEHVQTMVGEDTLKNAELSIKELISALTKIEENWD